jgi:hypothetical protein
MKRLKPDTHHAWGFLAIESNARNRVGQVRASEQDLRFFLQASAAGLDKNVAVKR